mgnify:FL=1
MEQNLPNREIIDATQDAVLNAAGSVANVLENTAREISGHGEAFYLSPEFWVGVSFVVAVVGLAKPVSKALYGMLKKRGESIAERIKDAAALKEDAQKLLVEYEKKARQVGQEAQEIIARSDREINLMKKESMSKLEKDMALKEHEAKSRIAAAQDKAMQEIARQTTELTINAVKKLLSSKLSVKMQDKLIDESIDVIAEQKKV